MPPPGLPSPLPLAVHVFRRPLPYAQTLGLQDALFNLRSAARKAAPDGETARRDVLLLLEHRPTYTTGRRDSSEASLARVRAEAARLERAGAAWAVTRRGGQVTYHGPGQVVGYLLADLGTMKLSTKCYVDKVQRVLRAFVEARAGQPVFAPHPDGHVGVFPAAETKVSSIGIHIRQRLTTHGFALNLTEEPLPWFEHITACGLPSIRATSLASLAQPSTSSSAPSSAAEAAGGGTSPLALDSAARALADRFGAEFGAAGEWAPLDLKTDAGLLVRALEQESAEDGEVWPAAPRADGNGGEGETARG